MNLLVVVLDLFWMRLGSVWRLFGTSLGVVWYLFGTRLGLVWDLFGVVWDLLESRLVPELNCLN